MVPKCKARVFNATESRASCDDLLCASNHLQYEHISDPGPLIWGGALCMNSGVLAFLLCICCVSSNQDLQGVEFFAGNAAVSESLRDIGWHIVSAWCLAFCVKIC